MGPGLQVTLTYVLGGGPGGGYGTMVARVISGHELKGWPKGPSLMGFAAVRFRPLCWLDGGSVTAILGDGGK